LFQLLAVAGSVYMTDLHATMSFLPAHKLTTLN